MLVDFCVGFGKTLMIFTFVPLYSTAISFMVLGGALGGINYLYPSTKMLPLTM